MDKNIFSFLIAFGFVCGCYNQSLFAEETEPPILPEEPVVEVQEEVTPEEESAAPDTEEPTPPTEEYPEPEEPLNGWQNNNTQYYQDGVAVDGVRTIDGNVYYFKDTVLNKYTGFVKNNEQNNWVFVRNGKSDWKFTGVAKSIANNEWYHAKNGILDWNFTGFSKSVENGKWYVSHKGKLNWNYTGVAKSIANGEWYHAKNGRLDWGFTGFSKSYLTNKWYVSYKGKLNWNYTGLAKSIANGEWYHATKGRLDWGFTGVSRSYLTKKLYYSRNGKLDWNKNGYFKQKPGERYNIKNGRATYLRYVIAIDPGHGGFNSGTTTAGPYLEKVLNLKIAQYLQRELSKYSDVYVVMTRTTDKDVDFEERLLISKQYDADYFISLHLNASVSHVAYGAEVYYQNANWKPGLSTKSRQMADAIQTQLVGLGARNLGIKTRESTSILYPNGSVADHYKVIRFGKIHDIPSIIVEHCCADHPSDYARFLSSEAKLKSLAQADARGIINALKL